MEREYKFDSISGITYVVDDYGWRCIVDVELRKMKLNSFFWPEEWDDTITSVNAATGNIIYDLWNAGRRWIEVVENNNPDIGDTIIGCHKILYWYENEDFGDKVPPTFVLPNYSREYWEDILDKKFF